MKMRPPALRIAVAAASVSLAALAIPLLGSTVGAADSGNAIPAVVNPSTPPLFTECPAVGHNTGCAVLITLNANGTATFQTDSNQGPFDGSDDTLVGVVNNTGVPIPSINLTSTNDIFNFDGDGICTFDFTGDSYCNNTAIVYDGPTSTFSNISSDFTTGSVNFGPALASGSSTYFSLENSLTGADFIIPADFTVTKSVTSTGPYIAGDTSTPIDYQIAAHNFGGTPGDIVVSDTLPSNTTLVAGSDACPAVTLPTTCTHSFDSGTGTETWVLDNVAAGATVNLAVSVTPNFSTTGYTVNNTALWEGPGCANNPPTAVSRDAVVSGCPSNAPPVNVIPPSANFSVVKAVTSTGPYFAGDTATPITYSLTATNAASATAAGNVAITDMVPTGTTLSGTPACPSTLPAGTTCTFSQSTNSLTWDFFDVPIGDSVSASFTVTINSGTTGSVSNTALWAGPGCTTDPQGPVPVEATVGAPGADVAAGPTPCPTNTTTTTVTPPISVTITASNTSTAVGTVPKPTCSVTGDTLGAPATGANPATTVTTSTGAGTYNGANTCSGAADPRYTFTYVPGNAVVTAAPATAAATTPTTAAPAAAAPVTAPSTSPSIAFTGALLDQEWIAGIAAVILGLGLLAAARGRRRSARHAGER